MADSEPTTPGKSPAFQFYVKDFLSDADQAGMSLLETGAYIRLMCFEWNKAGNGIPDDVNRVARMVGMTPAQMRKLWPAIRECFTPHPSIPGRLIHPRLEREREKQARFRRRQSDAAAKRWQSHGNATAVPPHMPRECQTDALQSPISNLQSTDSSRKGKERTHHKVAFDGTRLKVWKWQHEDLGRRLGANGFDLLGWYTRVDAELEASGESIGDPWNWLQQRFKADAGIVSPDMFGPRGSKTAGNLAALQRFAAKGQA